MTSQSQNTRLQKLGGLAALTEALTFVVGFALFFTALAAADYGNFSEPVKNAAFLVENETLLNVWHFVIYIVFGVALVPLTLALQNRLSESPTLAQLGGVFGFIWAVLVIASGMVANVGGGVVSSLYARDPEAAGALWLNMQVIVDALGGGNETVGGIWLLLVSWAALSVSGLPRALNLLGLLVGTAAVLTNVPLLSEIGGIIFGLGLIVWFIWAGLALLRSNPAPRVQAKGHYA